MPDIKQTLRTELCLNIQSENTRIKNEHMLELYISKGEMIINLQLATNS